MLLAFRGAALVPSCLEAWSIGAPCYRAQTAVVRRTQSPKTAGGAADMAQGGLPAGGADLVTLGKMLRETAARL
jgi:hypothetical protein